MCVTQISDYSRECRVCTVYENPTGINELFNRIKRNVTKIRRQRVCASVHHTYGRTKRHGYKETSKQKRIAKSSNARIIQNFCFLFDRKYLTRKWWVFQSRCYNSNMASFKVENPSLYLISHSLTPSYVSEEN